MILRKKWTLIWINLIIILKFLVICIESYSIHDAPDYQSLLSRNNSFNYLYVIAFVDKTTANIYHNDLPTIKRAVRATFTTASTYFYQLNIKLILKDVFITNKNFKQLSETNEYHNNLRKQHVLPYHDFAVFLVTGRNSGLSWPGQLCRPYNGIIVQMSPLNPEESGPSIFEEFANLVNVTKSENTEKTVTNCRCRGYYSRKRTSGKTLSSDFNDKCLVIPGYFYNCSAQALYNKIQSSKCILKKMRTHEDDVNEGYSTNSAAQIQLNRISLCGNGIVESGEHCDCGYRDTCHRERICDQKRCRWQDDKSTEDEEILEEDICECTLTRKFFEQHCGKRKCTLNLPLWITHFILYSIFSFMLTIFCCGFSCIIGRNPEKIYRQSVIMDSRPKNPPPPPPAFLKPKFKETVVTINRPTVAPPPPPHITENKLKNPVTLKLSANSVNLARSTFYPSKGMKEENPYDKVPVC